MDLLPTQGRSAEMEALVRQPTRSASGFCIAGFVFSVFQDEAAQPLGEGLVLLDGRQSGAPKYGLIDS